MEEIIVVVPEEESEEVVNFYHENYVTFMTQRKDIGDGKVEIKVTHFGKR